MTDPRMATEAPVETPTIAPTPESTPWPDTFTDPIKICPQQRREEISPDIAP